MKKILFVFSIAAIVFSTSAFSEFKCPSYMYRCDKTSPHRWFYLALAPISGVGVGVNTTDISLKLANVAIGYDFSRYFGAQIEFDYDYFIEIGEAGGYDLFNSALNLHLYPINGRVRPFVFVGGGVYTYLSESQYTSRVEYDLMGQGGLGLGINLTRKSSLDIKAYPRYYNELGNPFDYIGYYSINFAVMYKFTF